MSASRHFAQTYAEARDKFLAACADAGLSVNTLRHPLPGRDGEVLALDAARFGPADASALLVLSSACHGVEGFCGSGVQVDLLRDPSWHEAAGAAGVAVLYLHGLNPHGFSFWRRTTHENIDLNRNFQDFSQPLPRNAAYDEIAGLVVPPSWPPSAAVRQGIEDYIARHGLAALQAAISTGQSDHADGLFFAGRGPSWSQLVLRPLLRAQGARCRRLAWIDLHTGLGPSGHGELIHAGGDDPAALARARRWWGAEVTSIYDGSSVSARIQGQMAACAVQECPQAEFTGLAIEYGTVPMLEVMDALRADQWLQAHPETGAGQAAAIKQQLRDAFYTDTESWKQRVVEQAQAVARQALQGLRG